MAVSVAGLREEEEEAAGSFVMLEIEGARRFSRKEPLGLPVDRSREMGLESWVSFEEEFEEEENRDAFRSSCASECEGAKLRGRVSLLAQSASPYIPPIASVTWWLSSVMDI